MRKRIKSILVMDSNGDQLILYAIAERFPLFGLLARRRLVLATGEVVRRVRGQYVVIATGERLIPVEAPD